MIDSLTSEPATPAEYCAAEGHSYSDPQRDRCDICLAPTCSICDKPIDTPGAYANRHFPPEGEAHAECCDRRGCEPTT